MERCAYIPYYTLDYLNVSQEGPFSGPLTNGLEWSTCANVTMRVRLFFKDQHPPEPVIYKWRNRGTGEVFLGDTLTYTFTEAHGAGNYDVFDITITTGDGCTINKIARFSSIVLVWCSTVRPLCKTKCLIETVVLPASRLLSITDSAGNVYAVPGNNYFDCVGSFGNLSAASAIRQLISEIHGCSATNGLDVDYELAPKAAGSNLCVKLTIKNSPMVVDSIQMGEGSYIFNKVRC